MADRGRPIPIGAAIYASAHKAVQPPDDRTYSAEVTVFQRNLPHHRSARAESPYTRSYIIPPWLRIVKQNFRKNHKFRTKFSYNLRAAGRPANALRTLGGHRTSLGPLDKYYSEILCFSVPMPSPGGKVPPKGADEERRQLTTRSAVKLRAYSLQNSTFFTNCVYSRDTFRRSSSVSLRSTASSLWNDCHRQSFLF